MIDVQIKHAPISYESILDGISDPSHGARNIFLGEVRNHNHGKKVKHLDYDLHDVLALKVMEEICQEARDRWGEELKIRLHHSKGRIEIGEASVGILVSSPHRDESFEACRYVIEELKKRVPIWKNETYEDGESGWLDGNSLCSCEVNP